MIDIDKTKDAVEGEIRYRVSQVKDAYDELESISAKIKMWVRLNKVEIGIYAGFLLAGIIIGTFI